MKTDWDEPRTDVHCVNGACPGGGQLRVEAPPEVPLGEALTRWEKEAARGACHTGRYRCRYFVWGSGPPLVFIHGLNDRPRSFAPVIAHLAQRFTCVAYHLPEGGDDGAKVGGYRLPHLAADLVALCDHLRLPRSYLFGSSFGSTVALTAMHGHPGRFPRAVLQGGFARRPMALWELTLCQAARYFPGAMRSFPIRRVVQNRESYGEFAARGLQDRWEFLLENSGVTPIRAVAYRGLLVHRTDLRQLLPRVRQPVLLVCGDSDPVVPAACEAPLLERLPCVERVEFPGCGHFPQYTHAALVAELTRRFLTPPPG
jgi:pimeloyl-ACP methyl ester carboxylesterase